MMKTYQAEPLLSEAYQLAEGPFYRPKEDILSWVDISASKIIEYQGNKVSATYALGQFVGAAVPSAAGGYIAALATGLYRFSPEDGLKRLCQPPDLTDNHRFNDAKCDPQGRLWAGSMRLFQTTGQPDSCLYCYDFAAGCRIMRTEIGLSNGLAWSPDQKRLYHIDTPARTIAVFDFNPESGSLGQLQKVIPVRQGNPDGMTIDREGMLWVALWGGHAVIRIDPDSEQVIGQVAVPTAHVTSCCFYGSGLDRLVITTAKDGSDPMGGRIYVAPVETCGRPDVLYQG